MNRHLEWDGGRHMHIHYISISMHCIFFLHFMSDEHI